MGPDQALLIHGIEATSIAIMGEVLEARIEQTGTTYLRLRVDDGTGCLEVRKYFDSGDDGRMEEYDTKFKAGTWWHIYGYIRSFNKRFWFSAFEIRQVSLHVIIELSGQGKAKAKA